MSDSTPPSQEPSDQPRTAGLALAAGSPVCVFCHGTGYKHGKKGIGHGVPDCEWCNGLGASFSDVIFRGHPAFEGRATVIEGCCPVLLRIDHEGRELVFERAAEKEPPFWFVKENGKQVYRFKANVKDEPRLWLARLVRKHEA